MWRAPSSGIGAIYGKGVRPQGWTTAFAEQSKKSFADTLAEDVTLEASILARPIVGRNRVKHVMGAASKIYEALDFTHHAENGARTYLEWQAKAFGGEPSAGVTVLTKDERGLIAHVAIHHRPSPRCSVFRRSCVTGFGAPSSPTISSAASEEPAAP